MFDVLTYEKGGARAAHARAVPRRGALPRRHPPLPRHPRLRQHRDHRPVGRHRGGHRRAGAPDHGHLDLPGRPPVVTVEARADGRVLHLSQQRFRYLADAADGARWAVPMQLRYGTASGDVVHTTELLDGDQLEIDLPEAVTWVVANAEGAGFYRVHTSGPLRDALAAGPGSSPTSSATASSTTPGRRCWPAPPRAEEFVALAERLAGERGRLGVAADPRRPGRDRPGGPRRRPRPHCRPAPARSSAPPSSGWAGRPTRATRTATASCGPLLIGAAVTLAADPAAEAQARTLFARVCADSSAVEANIAGSRRCGPSPRVATPADVDALLDGLPHRRHPAGGAALPLRAGRGARPRAVRPRARAGHLDRGAHAERARTSSAPAWPTATTAPRRGRRSAAAWDELNERFPSNSIARMLNGIRAVSDPALAADIEAFLEAHPVVQAKQAVAQHLERMRVSVALRERVRTS